MEILMEQVVKHLLTKETAFFGLFLLSYVMQYRDKNILQAFIMKQQDVLADLTDSVKDIARTQERQHERIERMEDNLDRFYDKVNNRLNDSIK